MQEYVKMLILIITWIVLSENNSKTTTDVYNKTGKFLKHYGECKKPYIRVHIIWFNSTED